MLEVKTNTTAEPSYDTLLYCNCVRTNFLTCVKLNQFLQHFIRNCSDIIKFVPVTCPEIPGLLQAGTTGF